MSDAGRVASRKMFGGYAIYCDDKVVALVCDSQLFVKPTEKGRVYIGDVVEAPPYQGAKQYFLIEDRFEDREWISELIRITTKAVTNNDPENLPAISDLRDDCFRYFDGLAGKERASRSTISDHRHPAYLGKPWMSSANSFLCRA